MLVMPPGSTFHSRMAVQRVADCWMRRQKKLITQVLPCTTHEPDDAGFFGRCCYALGLFTTARRRTSSALMALAPVRRSASTDVCGTGSIDCKLVSQAAHASTEPLFDRARLEGAINEQQVGLYSGRHLDLSVQCASVPSQ